MGRAAHAPAASESVLPGAVIDAAIGWAVRLDHNQPSEDDRRAFARWLQADHRHAIAWERIHGFRGFRRELNGLSAQQALVTLQAAEARRHAEVGGIASSGRRRAGKLLAWAALATTTGWFTREHTPWQRLFSDASTGVGEQKTLRLADGSVIVLNTDSAVSVDLAGAGRRVVLRRGEVLVSTGSDLDAASPRAPRPFWVDTPFGRLQALGTRFAVRLRGEGAMVSVQEGAVRLFPARGGETPVVPAGGSRWLDETGARAIATSSFAADDWVQGVVAGQDIRLQDLLAELERYRHGRIVCDPRVAERRLSGVFHVRDTDRTLQFLVQTQPLSVRYRTRFWISVGPDEGV